MKCVFCGGTVKEKLVTFSHQEGDTHLIVEHVPAEICEKCGEKTYSPKVTDELLRFTKEEFKPKRFIEVPVFDFAEIG